jgi:PII-like signaling protein
MVAVNASRLRVYVNARERSQGQPVYRAIVERARGMHLAGASAYLIEIGFGAHREVRDLASDYASYDAPVLVEVIDSDDRIAALRTELDALIVEGIVTIEPVSIARLGGSNDPAGADDGVVPAADVNTGGRIAMMTEGDAQQRLTVYIGSADTWHGRNLAAAIVERCRGMGMAGASAMRGFMGFGKSSTVHRAHFLGLSDDLPERIEIVDHPDRIAQLLPLLDQMVRGGLVVLEDVHVIQYRHNPDPPANTGT